MPVSLLQLFPRCCCPRATEEQTQMADAAAAAVITHRHVAVNGINMHLAETGSSGHGPVVLFIHGFPENWYTWRHQIVALAGHGYHCVAPDLRGYGDTDVPEDINSYSMFHLVGDIVALIDSLGQQQVYVVAHDWGAIVAWSLCQFRPDKVKGLVALSVPFTPRNPARKSVEFLRATYGDDYYICRFQKPGEIEAEFASVGTSSVLKKLLTYRNPGPLFIPKQGWIAPGEQIPLPAWLSEDDIEHYAVTFDKNGFTGPVNYYRCLDLNWELTAPWTGSGVNVPTKFIIGDQDLTYNTMGTKDYIQKGLFKKYVPRLEEVVVMEGVGHFINEEKPAEITANIHDFIKKF